MSQRPPFDPRYYADHLKKSGDFAQLNNELHQWTGKYWKKMSIAEVEEHAIYWNVQNLHGVIVKFAHIKDALQFARRWVPAIEKPETDDLLIPLQNGYLQYEGGKFVLKPHDKTSAIDYLINCDYAPASPAPALFIKFIEQILPDEEVRARVQEYLGYTLTSDARHQRGQIWLGSGANGKGVLANIIQSFHANVATLNLADIGGFGLSHLPGASLIYVDEIPLCKIDEAILKKLIAGENSTIKLHYRPAINARILAKWLVLGNTIPQVEDRSDGFWRRFDLVPFNVTIAEKDRDPNLAKKIIASELPGVLAWLLAGLERLLKRGRFDPVKPAAIAALDNYSRTHTDSVRSWVEDAEIHISTDTATHKDAVYQEYSSWCKRNGLQAQAANRFWPALENTFPNSIFYDRMHDHMKRKVRTCNILLSN